MGVDPTQNSDYHPADVLEAINLSKYETLSLALAARCHVARRGPMDKIEPQFTLV